MHALRILVGIDVEAGWVEHGAHRGVQVRIRVGRIRIDAIAIRRPRVHVVQSGFAHLSSRVISTAMVREGRDGINKVNKKKANGDAVAADLGVRRGSWSRAEPTASGDRQRVRARP